MPTVKVRAIITSDNRFLFVKNASSAAFWCLPGGKVDKGEDVIHALRRELEEELGVTPEVGNVVFVHQYPAEALDSLELFFHVRNSAAYADLMLDELAGGELREVAWLEPGAADILPGFLSEELSVVAGHNFKHPTQVWVDQG